jgi:transcriptional regulator, propionate catabolism operon regulatory protein
MIQYAMLKITFVIPYYDLEETVNKYLADARHQDAIFNTTHIVGTEDVKKLKFDCDIIIARGITCAALREYHPEITVVEIPVTGYDVICALDECKRRFGAKRIAVIGAVNMVYGSPILNNIMDIEVMVYRVNKEEDASYYIHDAVERGADAIVGGLMTYNFALQLGVNATWVKSREDAIKQAVDEAIRTSEIKEKERERAEFFQIIMDYTHEGILAVDRSGHITAVNTSAARMLGPHRKILGRPVGAVLSSNAISRVLERGEEELGALELVGETHVAANFVPIKIDNAVTGAVATLQNVSRIVEIENKIRKKILTKGHVSKYRFQDIIGGSPRIKTAISTAEKFSRVDANVLVYGETGTGKELFAHSIHSMSARSQGPFVAVNCAALPEQLLESELFGYAEGAFTGAMKGGKAGLFEIAHEGTIFLDEVGEIPLTLQAKLLRVLQEREIMRIGHDRVIPVNVRIIAATNKDLGRMAKEGNFRQDILFRLDVLHINVPPLRQRREDIPLLIDHYMNLYRTRMGLSGVTLSPSVLELLESYSWPGNVRELANLCERLSALCEGNIIDCADIEGLAADAVEKPTCPVPENLDGEAVPELKTLEKQAIIAAVQAAGGNHSQAARSLGISRSTLWRKLKSLKLQK